MLQHRPALSSDCKVQCSRCGAVLYRNVANALERTIALSLAGLILFCIANLFPFMAFEIGNQATQTTLYTGVRELYQQGLWMLAALVFFTSILAPLIQLSLMLYIFVPLKVNRLAQYARPAYRLLQRIRSWNMVEVFMISILVALVKLTKMATITPGIAMWSFLAMIFVITAANASVDGRLIWERLETSK